MEETKILELDIADAIIDRPKGFSIGHRHFYLYPMTLGKMYLTQRVVENMEIDAAILKSLPFGEALRLVKAKREDCAMLIAYHSLKTKQEVLNNRTVTTRKNFFAKEMEDGDMASMVIMCLAWDNTAKFMHHLKIEAEVERMQKVMAVKDNKNTYNFGGVSIYGSIIDNACERYGWTYDYVVWEISYTNLQLMLKDGIKSVFLSDDEAMRCHVPKDGQVLDGNNIETMQEVIEGMDWS